MAAPARACVDSARASPGMLWWCVSSLCYLICVGLIRGMRPALRPVISVFQANSWAVASYSYLFSIRPPPLYKILGKGHAAGDSRACVPRGLWSRRSVACQHGFPLWRSTRLASARDDAATAGSQAPRAAAAFGARGAWLAARVYLPHPRPLPLPSRHREHLHAAVLYSVCGVL